MSITSWTENPAVRLEAVFRTIHAGRMQGLPFVNEALEVEAVGFAPWDAHWLGILLTPWSMNLMLVPREAAGWQSIAPGDKRAYRFPAGVYDFVSGREDTIGEYQACSLFSPMFEFADQVSARLTAEAALRALFDVANCDSAHAPSAGPAPMTKREFLRVGTRSGDREPRR